MDAEPVLVEPSGVPVLALDGVALDGMAAAAGELAAGGVPLVPVPGLVAARAALKSWGIIKGVEAVVARLMLPSSFRVSGLEPKKSLVYMTFSATYSWAQSGIEDMSILLPHLAASG